MNLHYCGIYCRLMTMVLFALWAAMVFFCPLSAGTAVTYKNQNGRLKSYLRTILNIGIDSDVKV